MILAAQPPQPSQDYYHRRRQRSSSRGTAALDFSSSSSPIARPPDFSSALETVSLAFDNSRQSFNSRFNFADQFAATLPQQQQQQQQTADGGDSFMNSTADYYTPNRTHTAARRSVSQQLNGGEQQRGQWFQIGGHHQSHLAPQPRHRLHGQLAGHKRNHSGSTVASTAPSSPFAPSVQAYPHIHDPDAAPQYSAPLVESYDLTPQQQAAYKPLPAAQQPNFTEPLFPTNYVPQPSQQYQSHGDPNLAYQLMMRRAIMSQDSTGSSGGGPNVPSLQRLPTSEFEREYKSTVPKLDRTYSDAIQDELYNPSLAEMVTPTSQPQRQQQQLPTISSHRNVFSECLQAANNGHLSARSGTPTTMSRGRSPFQATSQYANDEIAPVHTGSPSSRLGSAAHIREQQKAEADAAAWSQSREQHRRSLEEPETISPKDALLDGVDTDVEQMPSLFAPDSGHRFSLPQDPQYSLQHDPQYGGVRRHSSSAQSVVQQQQARRHHSQQQQRSLFTPQQQQAFSHTQQSFASQESNPEFPAHLTSMESTRSDIFNTPSSSQQSDSSTHPSSDMPLQRPEHTMANAGSYACPQPGCMARFDGPGRLQRHRREAHSTVTPPAAVMVPQQQQLHLNSGSDGSAGEEDADQTTDDQTGGLRGAALAARNSQAGPHKCERINPSTGKPCNSIFSRPYDLTRHEETIHNARKQKVRCQFCTEEKTFSRSDALTRHMRVVHPEMEFTGKRARRA